MEENAAHTVRAEILIETDSDEAAEKAVTDALLATPGVFLVTIHREVEYSN